MPHDWIRLEQLINEIFGILNEETTLSDVVSNITTDASNLKIVSDALSTEVSDRVSDIKYLSDSLVTVSNALSTEVSDRNSDIKYLSDALILAGSASDLKVVSDALSTEVSDRISDIKYLSDALVTVSNSLSTEVSDRASDIKYLSDSLVTVSNALSTEISDRQSDELFLSDAIVTVSNALSDVVSDIAGLSDCPTHLYIKALAQAEGDLHLSDGTNWNVSKALIAMIRIVTSSTNWDLYLLQNDNGYAANDAVIPALKIGGGIVGNANLKLDVPYQDEDATNEVHLYFLDNSGANTADIYIKGYSLS